ncbi:MAG: LPS export ABC transporter ATP-binding protein [Planctomycetaceae bacterium]|nr:LPS export ABC transporter ATP-binding protein [Planctomycetaceae bacterium]
MPSFSETSQIPVLKAEGLVKIYGRRRVVDGVSFHVNCGEIVGLLGPNGAGKTTSFRMTCGLISANGGIVYLGAQNVTNWPMYRRSKEGGMGYLPQDKSVFQKLSVQNNLLGMMEMLGVKSAERKKRCNELLEKFGLTALRKNYAGGLSGGERRRLEIARSLVSNPKIILLDEPFAAVDPITVTNIQKTIRQLADEGISILITDHSVQDTLQITERSYVIQAGKVLCHGTPAEVLTNPEARQVYFGENVSIGQIQPQGGHAKVVEKPSVPDSITPPYNTSPHKERTFKTILGVKKSPPQTGGMTGSIAPAHEVPVEEPAKKPVVKMHNFVRPAVRQEHVGNTEVQPHQQVIYHNLPDKPAEKKEHDPASTSIIQSLRVKILGE